MRNLGFAPRLLGAVALVVLPGLGEAWAQNCDPDHLIQWPEADPVWEICWVSPVNSSGIDGSGLELTWAAYMGKQVLSRGNMPVINVKYDPGGCGGPNLSFRDWGNQLVRFAADNEIRPGYAEPTVSPQTVCAHPGFDAGSFQGVAAEKLADRLILTTQIKAGWYRYIPTWTFYLDGRLQPAFAFTAVDNTCTPLAHNHHMYWRFDFDIEGSANDVIQEHNSGTWTTLATEAQRVRNAGSGRRWRVGDSVTGGAWEIWPGPEDGPADAWAVADVWALKFSDSEHDDGGATGGTNGDQAHMGVYVNGQSINGQDIVVWYRGGNRHVGAEGGGCEIVGPMLAPSGVGPPPNQNAVYDPAVRAPKCAALGVRCDSGPILLNGRDGKGPERNRPNTVNNSCADGTSGTYHVDESVDRVVVSTLDGTNFAPGKTVRVDATVWAWTTPSADKLELYYAANAGSPSWTLITILTPTLVGPQTLSANYTLPSGTLQAVRARFRYQGTAQACLAGRYNDHDDLVFAVR